MGTRKKKITTKDLKKLTGKSKPTIRRAIRKLEKKNIITYTARNGKHDGNWFSIEYGSNQIATQKNTKKKSSSKKKKPKTKYNKKKRGTTSKKKSKQNDFFSEYGIA